MARAKLSAVETGARRKAKKKKKKTRTRLRYLSRGEEAQTGQAKKKRNGERNGTSAHLSAGGFPGPHTSLGEKYQSPWKFHLNGNELEFRFREIEK